MEVMFLPVSVCLVICLSLCPLDYASAVLLSYVVRPSACPSVSLSVTLMYRGHIGWTFVKHFSKISRFFRAVQSK